MFVVNLFELTNFLRGNSQYKYVLDIIDHFSKMLMSHLIKWGTPSILQSDNEKNL